MWNSSIRSEILDMFDDYQVLEYDDSLSISTLKLPKDKWKEWSSTPAGKQYAAEREKTTERKAYRAAWMRKNYKPTGRPRGRPRLGVAECAANLDVVDCAGQ
jgi:hypothetical protein